MDRRELFKKLAVLGLGTAIPFRHLQAFTRGITDINKRPFHNFKLGDLELTVITDGHLTLSPVQPNFPNGDQASEQALLRSNFRSVDEVDLGMNILVIKKRSDMILVDTGTGSQFGAGSGWMLPSMQDAGITPESITAVIISHAHPDHIGGLLTTEGTPVFKNAQVYLSKPEHAFWMAPQQDFSKSKFQDKKLLAVFTAATQKTLKTLSSRLHLFDHNTELFGYLRLEIAPGHTPGHTLVHIFSGQDEMVHIADLMHSDLLSFHHPEWGFNGDTDLELAVSTRKRVLADLMQQQKKVFGYHLPWPGIGHVRRQGEGFEWVAEVYAFPG